MPERERVDREQRVEPPAGLVDGLADEVGGKAVFERVGVVERVVELRGGHGAGVEPRIEHGLDPVCGSGLTRRTRDRDVVDVGTVQIHAVEIATGELCELGDGPDARVVPAVVTAPYRDRRAPVAITGECPVDVVLEPVAEPAVLDVFRDTS